MKLLIFAVILVVVFCLICAMPTVSIDTEAVTSSSAIDFVRAACYFIPINTIASILTITIGLWAFRMVVALIKTIWAMLPVA